MYEVELKVPADHPPVRDRLLEADAERVGAVSQTDVYYDHPARSFAATDEALRLRRQSNGEDTLTYKGPLVDDASKTREERESAVADPDAVDAILRALDFSPAGEVRKERTLYDLRGFHVALDRVEGLGEYVEVEATGEESEIKSLRSGAQAVLEELGLGEREQVRRSYLELLSGD